ncbi:hypothetical protein EDD29_4899 [Actinocorallia herbida]|uniref:Lipoprotein n=1 Tax=Actinocorallia herbida TaxID=58109 RepID=A0A3N1D1B3_9ACTN|nr:hypothetical protein EDD29_4899 [Actinocorallia herbida]
MNAARFTALLLALTVTATGCQAKGYAKPIETPSRTAVQR